MTSYTVPADPADVEHAALDLIVHAPSQMLDSTPEQLRPLVELMQDFCGALQVEQALAGLAWHDAKHVAVAVAFDLCCRDDAADFLRRRAGNALSGADGIPWLNPERAAHAFTVAARLL